MLDAVGQQSARFISRSSTGDVQLRTQVGGNIGKAQAVLQEIRRFAFERDLDVDILCRDKGSALFGDHCLYDVKVNGPQADLEAIGAFLQQVNGR